MWKSIFDKLKEKGLNPYAPGQHKGLCDMPYCVVKEGTQIPSLQSNKLGQRKIDIIVFVPMSSYVVLESYMKKIRSALKELSNIRKTGHETPAVPDDIKEAYTASIEYTIIKKLEG